MLRSGSLSSGVDLGEGLDLHVAVLALPLVILLEKHRADQADDRVLIWEDADDIGAAFDFLVQALERVGGVQLAAVRAGKPM